MNLLTNLLRKINKGKNVRGTLDTRSFERIPFSYSWNNLVKSYDLRMFYVENSPDREEALKYTFELEKIHNELNYLAIRGFLYNKRRFLKVFF